MALRAGKRFFTQLLYGQEELITPKFYKRYTELTGLQDLCKGGNMVLITGPPGSGKSAVLTEFAKQELGESEHHVHPIYINMRAGTFNTAASFGEELKFQMSSLLKAAAGQTAVLRSDARALQNTSSSDMNGLLRGLRSLLSNWKMTNPTPPTLIIDEANRFREWNKYELPDLRTLHEYFAMLTTETNMANVILCSSDGLFKFWRSHRNSERYFTRVIGDLSEAQAQEFFMMLVLKGKPDLYRYRFRESVWEDIFSYVGGRPMLLKRVADILSRHIAMDGRFLSTSLQEAWNLEKKELVMSARAEVEKGFTPELIGAARVEKPWTAEEYKAVVSKMAEAKDGVLSVKQLVDTGIVSEKALHNMVEHNVVHYRQNSSPWASDLWYSGTWPIVMPPSNPRFHAMKYIVK